MRLVSVAVALAALTACGSSVEEDFEADLTRTGGCADVVLFAADEADSLLLRVEAGGLIDAAQAAGEETVTTFDLPDPDVQIRLEVGSRISDAICDDVVENGGPNVNETWTAVSGTATFTLTPDPDSAEEGTADLQLQDVVLEEEGGGESVTVESFDIADIRVGWLAG